MDILKHLQTFRSVVTFLADSSECPRTIYVVSEVGYSVFESEHVHCYKQGFQFKILNKMENSVDPDEMARYELSSGSPLFARVSV